MGAMRPSYLCRPAEPKKATTSPPVLLPAYYDDVPATSPFMFVLMMMLYLVC